MSWFPSRWIFTAFTVGVSMGLYQCSSASTGEGPDARVDAGDGGADGGGVDTGSGRDTGGVDVRDTGSEHEASPPPPALPPPTFNPPGPAPEGTPLLVGETITITGPSDAPADVQIFYTTSGAVPTPLNGTLYPPGSSIQIIYPGGATETVTAIAHDPSGAYSDSPPGEAIYDEEMVGCVGGCGPPVTFSQQSSTQNNDFPLGLSDTPGATICYSVDGVTVPTCTAQGTCVSPALTYNQILQIDGSLPPNPATGSVTVTAIACEAGQISTQPVSQTFILQVAPPTMALAGNAVPPTTGASNVPWPTGAAGLAPTIQSATHDSIVVKDSVALWYTFGTATSPTCASGNGGVGLPNPTTFGSAVGPAIAPIQSSSQTYQVIGCKQGYLPSAVVTFPVGIQMNAPVLASAASPYAYELDMAGAVGAVGTGIDDSANAGAPGEILCATTDGNPATCSVTGGVASCGGTGSSTPVVKNTGTTVSIVACAPGIATSTPSATTYTLQLAPPFLSTTDPAGNATGEPGWDWAGTGLPIATMTIPTGASTAAPNGYPYADGFTWSVGQVRQNVTPCTGSAGTPEPTGGCGPHAYFAPDYYCWSLAGTAACGTGGTCTAGTAQAVTAAGNPAAVLPGTGSTGAGVTASSTLSIVACDKGAAGEDVFAPSAPTNVAF